MNLAQFKSTLAENRGKNIRFVLPTGSAIPPHAHVTEVAQIDKRFIDCGGTLRTDSVCRLQTWLEDDTEHRLTAGKLLAILDKSQSVIADETLDVEIEHEAPFISHFPIGAAQAKGDSIYFQLEIKHTDCLAKDQCQPPRSERRETFSLLPEFKPAAPCCGGAC